ncbi:adenosylcobinamide-GDP ribazoletransferase [Microaerobacter geothermalis]|uniref:adenosylcobinamide-GDP ribazoletransferase n=1 Tax=Microaerobacter geothermalis TaxID=674972 RepID=UPI001F29D3A6|nr:adenosylcobinamide-GDP ribazoletransferase [Microaerobacter geothermalis]MCF6095379.1 adenosylcobinamide-GDP ribazoletransferase [Microaerobacter geothermalis]
MKPFLSTLLFLTRLPFPHSTDANFAMKASLPFFPIVGLIIGSAVYFADLLLQIFFPSTIVAALLLIILFFMTGGLHTDGLIDMADGLLSHRSREQMLSIMKDSRVGAMGATVAILYFLLKWSALKEIPAVWRFEVLITMPVISRLAMVWAISLWPYARKKGMGSAFKAEGKWPVFLATLISLVLVYLIWKWTGVLVMGSALLFTFLLASLISRRLGGLTGDIYGGINELIELWVLLVGLLLFNQ